MTWSLALVAACPAPCVSSGQMVPTIKQGLGDGTLQVTFAEPSLSSDLLHR